MDRVASLLGRGNVEDLFTLALFPYLEMIDSSFFLFVPKGRSLLVAFDKPSKANRVPLNSTEFDVMIQSGAAFATQFQFDDPVLDRIDRKILNRSPGEVVPGGWCLGDSRNSTCSVWGDADVLRPGSGIKKT
ncbi:hypothetical protein Dsin_027341 [Dipteronia sinensis]|uniref:Uncharacterized protein n=1 Tax=Dipteronia sinensis TaxID=43782 RepID=A0AAE0DTC9_9ROSI|nr:hypothetical protein Dsin_027341 [Dipteronia sinensis]